MTVLALKNYEDKIEIAADSGTFYGQDGAKENGSIKIVSPKENFHFAATGWVSEKNLFELFCLKNEPEANTRHAILRYFSDFIHWKKQFTDKLEQNCHYFIIYETLCYQIQGGFDIESIPTGSFRALGAGMQEAKCAMYLGRSPYEAVELCLKLNAWTSGEIQQLTITK